VAQSGQCGQLFRQLDHGRVGATGQHDVVQLLQLIGQCGTDVRVAVAEQVDPPGADGVQVAAACGVIQPRPLRTRDGQQGLGLVPLHGGAGVPDGREAAGGEVRGGHCKNS